MNGKVNDGFGEFFAEKLWEMIPPVYRHEDGIAENAGVLRSFIELMARQAAVLRRSNDHLWDDQFIELCQDWAVPYLADLVGTRLVSSLNTRARRVDVAKTIYFRRRKGTLRVLEELIRDITGWDGKVVENFRRLARTRHGLDPEPGKLTGSLTGTPPGGLADLRSTHGSELVNGPFDEFHHTADMRKHCGENGRYAIPKLAFHLYTMVINKVTGATPFQKNGENLYAFNPSGRSIPLFIPDYRDAVDFDWDNSWHSAREWEVASPLSCRLLAYSEKAKAGAIIRNGDYTFVPERITAGCLNHPVSANPSDNQVVIDPEQGRFSFVAGIPPAGNPMVTYHFGFSARIGAGTYLRTRSDEPGTINKISGGTGSNPIYLQDEAINQVTDSLTYGTAQDELNILKLTLKAADGQRPYICPNKSWVFKGAGNESELCLDGIWLGSSRSDKPPVISNRRNKSKQAEGSSLPEQTRLVLSGNFKCVVIKHSTIDPGGDANLNNEVIHPVPLEIAGHIDYLLIDSCITGPVYTSVNGHVEHLIIRDSIVQSAGDEKALDIRNGLVSMEHVTVLGEIKVHRLEASEVLITGTASVTDTQHGCFRFSAAPVESTLPRKYMPFMFGKEEIHWFTSRKFGHPGFGQLSESAPIGISRGAENKCEMGAFNSLVNQIKADSLLKKAEEYMPFGLIPIFHREI
jgi:hypothetical protein